MTISFRELEKQLSTIGGSAMFGPCTTPFLKDGLGWSERRTMGLGWLLYAFTRAVTPETILEVGSGGSSFPILTAIRDNGIGHLYTMDTFHWGPLDSELHSNYLIDEEGNSLNAHHAAFLKSLKEHEYESLCTFLHGRSQDLASGWDKRVDLLVVDGDHAYEGVKKDWVNFSKWINLGGYALFHDPIACLYEIGKMLEEEVTGEWGMLWEPDYLSMAIIQRRYTISVKVYLIVTRLNAIGSDDRTRINPQWENCPLNLQNARRVPGLLRKWTGKWLEPEIIQTTNLREEAYKMADEYMNSGVVQTTESFRKFLEDRGEL